MRGEGLHTSEGFITGNSGLEQFRNPHVKDH